MMCVTTIILSLYIISIDDAKLAVKKLKSGKSGGSSGIISDCYVRDGPLFLSTEASFLAENFR